MTYFRIYLQIFAYGCFVIEPPDAIQIAPACLDTAMKIRIAGLDKETSQRRPIELLGATVSIGRYCISAALPTTRRYDAI